LPVREVILIEQGHRRFFAVRIGLAWIIHESKWPQMIQE